jgi:hypothetical protein
MVAGHTSRAQTRNSWRAFTSLPSSRSFCPDSDALAQAIFSSAALAVAGNPEIAAKHVTAAMTLARLLRVIE